MKKTIDTDAAGIGAKPTGVRRIWLAFFYSMAGLRTAWQGEAAFRQEAALAVLLLPLSFFIGRSAVDYILLVGAVLLLLIVELLNSAIESTIDRIGTERHDLSKAAKDMGSAAVFLCLTLLTFVWAAIIASRFFSQIVL